MKLINPGGGGSSPILAVNAGNTRTQAQYLPVAQGVVAMSSDLDIVLTPPVGTTEAHLTWDITGETDAQGGTGFVVYRDVAGGGYTLLPNSRGGSANYWECITTPVHEADVSTTPSQITISIIDESPTVGSVNTYRLYCVSTRSVTAGYYWWNRAVLTPADAAEACLSTFMGVCI